MSSIKAKQKIFLLILFLFNRLQPQSKLSSFSCVLLVSITYYYGLGINITFAHSFAHLFTHKRSKCSTEVCIQCFGGCWLLIWVSLQAVAILGQSKHYFGNFVKEIAVPVYLLMAGPLLHYSSSVFLLFCEI